MITKPSKNIPLVPEDYKKTVQRIFSSRLFPSYGQLATTTKDNIPQVRTVHFRYLKDGEVLAFPTHVKSQKWIQLTQNPVLSGCIFCNRYLVQLRWEATAVLVDHNTKDHQEERRVVWQKMRRDIKQAYWKDYCKHSMSIDEIDIDEPCPFMGIVINKVYLWDIWKLHGANYAKSKRAIYQLKNGEWQIKTLSPLRFSS